MGNCCDTKELTVLKIEKMYVQIGCVFVKVARVGGGVESVVGGDRGLGNFTYQRPVASSTCRGRRRGSCT